MKWLVWPNLHIENRGRNFSRIIARLKSARKGTKENNCYGKNWGHSGTCRSIHMRAIAGTKLPICEVMRFVCSDFCKRGITEKRSLQKVQAITFSEYLEFQSDALEFSKCQMHGQICGTSWSKKNQDSKEWACLQVGENFPGFGFYCPSVFKAGWPDSDRSKLV